jgi:hypothetical protein
MYCPKCGNENQDQQKFCTGCGQSLQMVAQALKGDPSVPMKTNDPIPESVGGKPILQNPLVYATLIIMIGLVIAVLGNKVLRDQTMSDLGTVMAVLGIGLIGFKAVLLTLSSHHSGHRDGGLALPGDRARIRSEADPQIHLLAEEPASIVEHTTRHLETASEGRKDPARDTQPNL